MLGERVSDPEGSEGGGETEGLSLLPVETVLLGEKTTRQYNGCFEQSEGIFAGLIGKEIEGYEIHMGQTKPVDAALVKPFSSGLTGYCRGNVYGTYVHGVFDKKEIAQFLVDTLAERKGVTLSDAEIFDYKEFKESQYDKLAEVLREHLDMEQIYGMLREADLKQE